MRRSVFILVALLLAAVVVFSAGQRLASRLCVQLASHPADDLDWLRQEFRLNAAELARVRQLHEGYLPQCRAFCERIDRSKQELQALFNAETNATSEVEQKLMEIGTLRAQCQAAMLRHFRDISQAMPAAQGKRYLAEMQRLTLGQHEQMEHTMSSGPAPHGHP